ncbi:MAG: hypothetical protein ACE37H_01890 [Phycisphaeraceae bacterium]
MTRFKRVTFGLCVLLLAWPAIADEPIEVVASQDLNVRRGNDNEGPVKENGILHPKKASDDKHPLDRFSMIRFDSQDFGKEVRAVELVLQAKDAETHDGRFRFRVYAVRDGDEQDEAFTEKDYDPSAEGTLFDGSSNMLDRKQVVVLGAFTSERGKEIRFSSNLLTSLVRADRNGTVTLVIARESDGGEDSVFHDRASETPPTLRLAKKK